MSAAPNGPRRQLSLAQARDELPAIVRDLAERGPVEITEDGEAVVVIVPLDEYRRLAGNRPSPWEAYERFRTAVNLEEIGIDDSFLEGLRDPSPGRDSELSTSASSWTPTPSRNRSALIQTRRLPSRAA